MTPWKITWFFCGQLKETIVMSDPYNLITHAQSHGVSDVYSIMKVERMPA